MVIFRAGATTRPGKVWADTTSTVMPDCFNIVFKVSLIGTGWVELPATNPWGVNSTGTPPTREPAISRLVDGVTLPDVSIVSVAALLTSPTVNGPTTSPCTCAVALATTSPSPDGASDAVEVTDAELPAPLSNPLL